MNGVLVARPLDKGKNMGDYIQSVAQEQFWEHIDCYVEREELDEISSKEKINLIMNAWFMLKPEHFPPSNSINPLYVSFHIAKKQAEKILSPLAIEHLKKYAPIGARDFMTRDLLLNHGIDSYFSGCLTITLGETYKSATKNNIIYFVDPYYELGGVLNKKNIIKLGCKAFFALIRHWKKVKKMKNFQYEVKYSLQNAPSWLLRILRLLMCASFYSTYSKAFSDDLLFNAEFVQHRINVEHLTTEEMRMEYARQLIRKYAQAQLVITSRLHCALPCLGVETPVIFVTSDALEEGKLRTAGRFGGNMELLHQMRWTPQGVYAVSEDLKKTMKSGKIEKSIKIENKEDYKRLRDELIQRVREFTKNQ